MGTRLSSSRFGIPRDKNVIVLWHPCTTEVLRLQSLCTILQTQTPLQEQSLGSRNFSVGEIQTSSLHWLVIKLIWSLGERLNSKRRTPMQKKTEFFVEIAKKLPKNPPQPEREAFPIMAPHQQNER